MDRQTVAEPEGRLLERDDPHIPPIMAGDLGSVWSLLPNVIFGRLLSTLDINVVKIAGGDNLARTRINHFELFMAENV